jgi:hypothetical protein
MQSPDCHKKLKFFRRRRFKWNWTLADQSTGIKWSNIAGLHSYATGWAIGTGQTNTAAIVGQDGCTSGAAYLCYNLTEGGHTDWFFPSKDELNKLYLNQVAIGGFADYYYWSSSEYNANNARGQDFYDGGQVKFDKGNPFRVRAVRVF